MKRVILGIGTCLMEEVTVMNDILLKQFVMVLDLVFERGDRQRNQE